MLGCDCGGCCETPLDARCVDDAWPANLPSLLALPPERVLDVFRSGPALAREGRYWVAGRGAREAR